MLPLRRNEWLSYNSTLSEYDLVGYWTLGLCPRNPRNSKFRLRNDVNVTEVKKKSDGDRSYLGGQRAACAANRTRVEARLIDARNDSHQQANIEDLLVLRPGTRASGCDFVGSDFIVIFAYRSVALISSVGSGITAACVLRRAIVLTNSFIPRAIASRVAHRIAIA